MFDWYESMYAFITNDFENKNELKRLYDNLNKACNTPCPQENDFGDSWLGHVAIIHNIPWESKDCRGYISRIHDLVENTLYFVVETETPSEPPSELFDCILKQYKGIMYLYIAEKVEKE